VCVCVRECERTAECGLIEEHVEVVLVRGMRRLMGVISCAPHPLSVSPRGGYTGPVVGTAKRGSALSHDITGMGLLACCCLTPFRDGLQLGMAVRYFPGS